MLHFLGEIYICMLFFSSRESEILHVLDKINKSSRLIALMSFMISAYYIDIMVGGSAYVSLHDTF